MLEINAMHIVWAEAPGLTYAYIQGFIQGKRGPDPPLPPPPLKIYGEGYPPTNF